MWPLKLTLIFSIFYDILKQITNLAATICFIGIKASGSLKLLREHLMPA